MYDVASNANRIKVDVLYANNLFRYSSICAQSFTNFTPESLAKSPFKALNEQLFLQGVQDYRYNQPFGFSAVRCRIGNMNCISRLLRITFAASCLAAAQLPAHSATGALFELERPVAGFATQHVLDSRMNFRLDASILPQLSLGETFDFQLPDQTSVRASVTRLKDYIGGTSIRHTVLSIKDGRGSVEFLYKGQAVSGVRISTIKDVVRVYEAALDGSGFGELIQQDANHHYCIKMPPETLAVIGDDEDPPLLLAATPGLPELQSLQSKPIANKVLYLNYWGGTLSGTRWNDEYTSGADINYTAYSSDADTGNFSTTDLYRMWMSWREVVEDYAPFDVNITTDQSVYDATPVEDRSMIVATTSYVWFGSQAGGVANLDSFGNEYTGVGWAWNKGLEALGQTISHEAGHQMGLLHDGQNPSTTYYTGHGTNDEWGPIMGAPYGQTYVQWSKGEYDNANNTEDDLDIIKTKLGEDADVVGDTLGSAFDISSSAYLEGVIEPRGLLAGMDTDVYRFQISPGSAQAVQIQVTAVLGDDTQRYGSNLSLDAKLTDSGGVTILAQSTQASPFYPQNNLLAYDGLLDPGTYYIFITALSPNDNWSTGFGEYADAGFYSVSLLSEAIEPDLVSNLSVEDNDVYIGQAINMSAQIQNVGTAGSEAGMVRFYSSTDTVISSPGDTEIVVRNTPALASLDSDFVNEQIIAPEVPGTLYYASCADTVTNESVVLNNCSAPVAIMINDLALDLDIGGALEQPSLSWVRGGDGSFFRQTVQSMNDGDAAQSGLIGDNEKSYVQLDYVQAAISGQEWVQFNWKVSSEVDYDYFRFIDNGQEVASISGEVGWVSIAHNLDSGLHRLQWIYDKDPFIFEGQDAGWLDEVVFLDRKLDISPYDVKGLEGDNGDTTSYSFTVQSSGDSTAPASVDYKITGFGANPADASDFGGSFPEGTIDFAAVETTQVIEIEVSGDILPEPDETFLMTLSNPIGAILGDTVSVQSRILDDDDDDNDGVQNTLDNCPIIPNSSQLDTDGDNDGNACDDDDDDDTVLDINDNCPLEVNPDQLDTDSDDKGDVCDSDTDNDGVLDAEDIELLNPLACEDMDFDSCDDCTIGVDGFGPLVDNNSLNDGTDTDADGACNDGDVDDDNDAVDDVSDNCILIPNYYQEDSDGNGVGDACDDDDDDDTVLDINDNCPLNWNPDQEDICSLCFPVKSSSGSYALICL